MTPINVDVTAEDIEYLIRRIPGDVNLTIVGGQALSFWATFFLLKFPEEFSGEKGLVMTTSDIDFVGSKEAAEKCAKAWNAEIIFPNAHDVVTPNTALVKVHIPHKGIIVLDFLRDYVGYSNIKTEIDDGVYINERQTIMVLGPIACLLSKMANVTVLRRHDEHAIGQLRTALVITRCAIKEHISELNYSEAQKALSLIMHIANKEHMGKPLFRQFGIDLLRCIPANLHGLHPKFISSIHQKSQEISQKRNRFDQGEAPCNN